MKTAGAEKLDRVALYLNAQAALYKEPLDYWLALKQAELTCLILSRVITHPTWTPRSHQWQEHAAEFCAGAFSS